MKSTTFALRTGSRPVVHDITRQCEQFARESSGGGDGLLNVFVPHATAGVAVLELGSGSDEDLLAALADLLPADDRWRHAHGSRGHGRSHVLPALIPPHATIPVIGGRMALGTWQSVALVDLNVDNPDREIRLSFLG
jgi:secondary thiamine-phosphate synthase enzyme